MKAQQGEEWLTEQRAADIRGIVQDVLADAETRTSLQSAGATAGYDNGFFISSADGNFRLNINGLVQFRWILNGAEDQNTKWGFDVRRARMDFSGVFAQDWNFKFQMQYGSAYDVAASPLNAVVDENGMPIGVTAGGGGINVLEAYVEREVDLGGTNFTVRGGQLKAPFLREWLVDDANQLAVDRSLLSYFFYQGYSVGLQAEYATDMLRATVAYTNGLGTPVDFGTGSYSTSWVSNPTQYSFAGRVDVKLSGNWDQFDDFNSRPGTESGIMLGVGALYQKYNSNAINLRENVNSPSVLGMTADVTWDFGGASLFASFVWENIDVNEDGVDNPNPWGFMVQGGYFLTDDLEVFARYAYSNSDYGDTDRTKLSLVTAGVNYFLSANAKLSADFGWSLNELGLFQSSGAGFRADKMEKKNQYAIRTQLQLTF